MVVVVAIVVFALAQGGGSGGGPLDAIAKAAEVTQREPGGRAVLRASVTSSTTPEGVTEVGAMIFDEHGRTRGTITVRGHSDGKEGTVVAIGDGTKVYMRSDLFGSLPDGRKWMELDLSKAGGPSSPAPVEGGPAEGLKLLEMVEDAQEVGKEDIRGVPTTHYTGTLPTADEVFGVKVEVSSPRIDAWIDAQDRVRRIQVVISRSQSEGGTPVTTKMTIDFVQFEKVPKIEVPPADEVFDATGEIESKVQSAAGN